MLNKFKTVVNSLENEHGSFLIFALFLREEPFERWDIIVSATWLNLGELASYKLISSKLQEFLTESELLLFSRIVLLDPDDEVVQFLLNLQTVKNGGYKEFSGEELTERFKFKIKKAYLLRSVNNFSDQGSSTL